MPKFESAELRQYAREVFIACKTPEDTADEVADALLLADLSGHPSHGIIRVPSYVEMIDDGRVIPGNSPIEVRRTPTTVLIDGNWGFGHPVAALTTRTVVEMAKENGIALGGCIHLNHVGRLGQWAEMAADMGMILIMTVGGKYTHLIAAPYGGVGRVLSTNPMAVSVPSASRGSLILDFATTASAEGKLRVARAKGAQAPPNTIIDKHGNPTTDPEDFYDEGMLLPFGGHKGYALSLMVDALSSCLTGAAQTDNVNKFGATLIGIDPSVFTSSDRYGSDVDSLFERVTSVPPAPGFDEVLIPGDPERRSRDRLSREGVEVSAATVEALRDVGKAMSVDTSVFHS